MPIRKKFRKVRDQVQSSMPDVNIDDWIREINNDQCKRMYVRVPDSVADGVEKYNLWRKRSGMKAVSKEEAILHFIMLGMERIEFKR